MWQTSAQCCKMVSIRGQYGLFCGKNSAFLSFVVTFVGIGGLAVSALE